MFINHGKGWVELGTGFGNNPVPGPTWAAGPPYTLGLSFFTSKMGITNTCFEGHVDRIKEDKRNA